MNETRARRIHRVTLAIWALLVASVAAWPLAESGIGLAITALALVPLLLPVPGLIRGLRRTLRWAPLTMAPALVLALTESLANARARAPSTLTLALIFAGFAAVVAALRASPRD